MKDTLPKKRDLDISGNNKSMKKIKPAPTMARNESIEEGWKINHNERWNQLF